MMEAINPYENAPMYEAVFNEIMQAARNNELPVVGRRFWDFVPYQQRVRLDALDKKDWPNGINDNSIYIEFKVNMKDNTFEACDCGHILLTRDDQKKSYLAMCTIKKAVEAVGGKWMRKSSYKDAKDLAKKVKKFWEQAVDCVAKATGGYPYKKMQINIY